VWKELNLVILSSGPDPDPDPPRPFGFNEFDGAGSGYSIKFASLFVVDEFIVVGSIPESAGSPTSSPEPSLLPWLNPPGTGKTSITNYGDIKELGEKFAKKREGTLIAAEAHKTEGIT
jgi:hypothetical protein